MVRASTRTSPCAASEHRREARFTAGPTAVYSRREARADHADRDEAARHADAHAEPHVLVRPARRDLHALLADALREPQRAPRVVGVGDRRADQDQHAVARLVLDRAAALGRRGADRVVVLAQDRDHLLRRGRRGEGGEAAQVAAHHRQLERLLVGRALQAAPRDQLAPPAAKGTST